MSLLVGCSDFMPEITTYARDRFEPISSVPRDRSRDLVGEVVARVSCLVTDEWDCLVLSRRRTGTGTDGRGAYTYMHGLMETRPAAERIVRPETPEEAVARVVWEQSGDALADHLRATLEHGLAPVTVFHPTDDLPFWECVYVLERVSTEAIMQDALSGTGRIPVEFFEQYFEQPHARGEPPVSPALKRAARSLIIPRI